MLALTWKNIYFYYSSVANVDTSIGAELYICEHRLSNIRQEQSNKR